MTTPNPSMIERMAEAAQRERQRLQIAGVTDKTDYQVGSPIGDGGRWKCLFGPASHAECRAWIEHQAMRAALEAAEPTEAMLMTFAELSRAEASWGEIEAAWRAMIDAALADPEPAAQRP